MRTICLASTSFLLSSLCAGVLAQTAQSPGSDTPAAETPASPAPASPAPATGETPASSPASPESGATQLPTIEVTPPKPTPTQPKAVRPVRPSAPAGSVSPSPPTRPERVGAPARPVSPAAPTPPSPYETGGPNVAGGTPVVPQLASQMTISGETLNARPIANSPENPGRRRPASPLSSTPAPAKQTNTICAATISTTAPTLLLSGTTCRSICPRTHTVRATPI